jgi:hypothetical protein
MTERSDQPSKVSTEEEVRPTDEHVVTSDLPQDVITASDDDQDAKPAASDKTKSDQTTDDSAASDDNQQQGKKRYRDRPATRRIKRLTKQVADLEAQRGSDKAEIAELREQLDQLQGATRQADPEPQFKDFDSPQEYAKEYAAWETRQAGGKPRSSDTGKPDSKPRDRSAHAQHDVAPAPPDPEVEDFRKRGQEKLGDEFMEALNLEGTAVDQDMGEFLIDSDYGPEIYVHLANNQAESRKIFDSSTRRKMSMLEDLEARAQKGELDIDQHDDDVDDDQANADRTDKTNQDKGEAGKSSSQANGQGQQTKAKDPPSDTRDGGGAQPQKDPEDESMDEYAARRKKEEMRKAGYNV